MHCHAFRPKGGCHRRETNFLRGPDWMSMLGVELDEVLVQPEVAWILSLCGQQKGLRATGIILSALLQGESQRPERDGWEMGHIRTHSQLSQGRPVKRFKCFARLGTP